MNVLKTAKEAILTFDFSDDAWEDLGEGQYYDGKYVLDYESLDKESLATSLHYFIESNLKRLKNGEEVPLGSSKIGGIPHLPKTWNRPENLEFYAQLNIADFKQFDPEDLFPEKGVLYLFIADDEPEFCNILFYDGSIDQLELKENTNETSTSGAPYQLSFTPKAIFYVEEDDYGFYAETDELIPSDLEEQLASLLKCKFTSDDPDYRIFGRPKFWQSEDIGYDDDNQPEESNKKAPKKNENRVLFFQGSFGEGNIHFWADKDQLKKGILDAAYVTYYGT